jgi:Ni,Fe-hydrogenase maturation factor
VIPTQLICDVCLSTHKLPLTVLTNYLDKTLGAKVGLVGIQPLSILFGEEMNPELVKAAEEVADAIAKVLLDR